MTKQPSLAAASRILGEALIPARKPKKSKVRLYATVKGAEKYRDKLRAQYPEKAFQLGVDPHGSFKHCVVQVHPKTRNIIAYCA